MKKFRRFAAGIVAAGMALAALPVSAAQAEDEYDWSHPITISNVQVTAVTDTTADVIFDYEFDAAKFAKITGSQAEITQVCFIVSVDKVLTMTPNERFYQQSWASGRMPYEDDFELCANMTGDDAVTSEQENKFYSLRNENLTATMGKQEYPEATMSMYSFMRSNNLKGSELKARGRESVHLKGLQPNMWYGNKNVPQKNDDNGIYPMSAGPLARWLLFREKLKEVAQPGDFDYATKYDGTCWSWDENNPDGKEESCSQEMKYALNKNHGQPINVDMNQLFIGAHVDFKYKGGGADQFSVYEDAVQVPSFTTKPKGSGSTVAFTDVHSNTPHVDDIRWLAANKLSEGYKNPNGTYRFEGMTSVYRQDMAAFLRREAVKRGISDAASWKPSAADRKRFRDVTCTADNKGNKNTPHCEDILWLAHANISEGWKEKDGSSTFRGMDTVKRQDMAAFLKRLAAKAGKGGNVKPKTDFTDVTDKTPHWREVQWLGGSGISEGYKNPNGTWRFEGMTSVYRQDMAAFIHRLDNLLGK